MNNFYNDDYQYDSCVSRGICSVNPRTSSLQEVLVIYLKITAYYALKLCEHDIQAKDAREIILYTISVMVSNPEFSELDFSVLTSRFNEVLPELIKKYEEICKEKNIEPDYIESPVKFDKKLNIIKSIQLGEKEYLKNAQDIPLEIRDLFKILFVIAKSICINVLDLESYEADSEEGYKTILRILDSLNANEKDVEKIKSVIIESSKIDNKLMNIVRKTQEERYGKQRINEVSYSTTPGKAILVVGSNIRELEDVLEAVKDTDIDVYTHDEMMLANTFPKFAEYKNLKGQYGQGMENCLLDFATFPGPIILTRHSLYNVEHLYRGRLYTTDYACSKGVISIKNKDFSDVIKAAEEAKGFKTGKQCETVSIGFDCENYKKLIEEKLKSRDYKRIFLIGQGGYTLEQQSYFTKLLNQMPEDILAVSLAYSSARDNVILLNACFDAFALVKISETIKELSDLPVTIFVPQCDRHTISQITYLSQNKNFQIYIGKCTPLQLNPNLIDTLHKVFGINGITSVKKDLTDISAQ